MKWYRKPENLLLEVGFTEPQHIDLEDIAHHLRAKVKYRSLKGCAARIIGLGDEAIITVDPNCKEERKRFSLGHEIGHWMKDKGKGAYLCQKEMIIEGEGKSSTNPETLANRYSSDLLLPDFMLGPRLKGREVTFNTVIDVGEEFKTGLITTAIKTVTLADLPSMLISFKKNGHRRFSRSPNLPDAIWPHDELHHETNAFSVLYGEVKEVGPLEVHSHLWINHRDSYKYKIIEHSIKTSEDTVYTILWWKDERQLFNL